jgi:hypothetical protein
MRNTHLFAMVAALFLVSGSAWTQPVPGDLYREYAWFNASGDCNGALRVGGNLDYRLTGLVDHYQGEGMICPPFEIDLNQAIRAELMVEKMLCHGDTEGLRVSINGNQAICLPEPVHIPHPQSAYAHHFNAIVPVELQELKQGTGNTFVFEVDTARHWWPQNLVYGMILRVYYEPSLLETRGRIIQPAAGDVLGTEIPVKLELPQEQQVENIDLLGFYDGPDMEGDGQYRKWHYSYHKGQIYNHITSVSHPPYQSIWNTNWIPDQDEDIKLAAFIYLESGQVYMTEAVGGLQLKRDGLAVELCKPYHRPRGWFTRNGEFSERFQIKGNLDKAVEAKMVFRTWSPGYFNGIYINDFIVFVKEGPRYDYYEHDIPLEALYPLKQGENILKTGKTPLYPEGMVHGVEVQWPGIMLLVRYEK